MKIDMPDAPKVYRALASGTRIGDYKLVERMAVGGMGDVWIAADTRTSDEVALKVFRATREERTKARERFRREASYGRELSHPSIVRVFDLLEEADGTLVLVMELLNGESLDRSLAATGALPAREAVAILVPILHALDHGHARAIIHRDVKPSNVFLAVSYAGAVVPKILDFGIAKVTTSGIETTKGRALGTPSYMSPEQIVAQERVDARTDVFSAGVVLYELLTGVCPFERPTQEEAMDAVLRDDVDPDPRIDPPLWMELQRALRKRPNERHDSAADLARAIASAIGETDASLAPLLEPGMIALRAWSSRV